MFANRAILRQHHRGFLGRVCQCNDSSSASDSRMNVSRSGFDRGKVGTRWRSPCRNAIAKIVQGSVDQQPAVHHHRNSIRHVFDVIEQMAAEQHGSLATIAKVDDRFIERSATDRIKPKCRVVQYQKLWVCRERRRDRDSSTLTSAQPMNSSCRINSKPSHRLIKKIRIPLNLTIQ